MNMSASQAAAERPPVPARPPAAALWDFDGTLVDTEPVWVQAQYALTDRLGVRWTDQDAERLVGNALLDSGRYIVSVLDAQLGPGHGWTPAGVVDELVTRVVAHIREHDIPWRPGARELLASFAAAGVPSALVSASYRVILDAVLDRLAPDTFATVVAGDDVTHGKPHPEPYLTAAHRLGVSAADCVVLEDSVPGAASGNAAGAVVVGIRHLVALPAQPRRVVIDTLAGLDAEAMARLVAGAS